MWIHKYTNLSRHPRPLRSRSPLSYVCGILYICESHQIYIQIYVYSVYLVWVHMYMDTYQTSLTSLAFSHLARHSPMYLEYHIYVNHTRYIQIHVYCVASMVRMYLRYIYKSRSPLSSL